MNRIRNSFKKMIGAREVLILVVVVAFATSLVRAGSRAANDNVNLIQDKIAAVTEENCRSKSRNELQLLYSTVAQMPRRSELSSATIYSNRSALLYFQNMVMNRAFFYSYILQALKSSFDFSYQPGLMYYYMSTAADVSGSDGFIDGSALFFDTNCSYPNYYGNQMHFNSTLPLFGPRAWRSDDHNDSCNFPTEPTANTLRVLDYGAGGISNYTSEFCNTNPWYKQWLPDQDLFSQYLRKYTYTVGIKYSNITGQFVKDEFEAMNFFGPPQPVDWYSSVHVTVPYFDCGGSNKWMVSATAPIVEYMPRYTSIIHLQWARYVAVATQDIEFEKIDINPCPLSEGNPRPNFFAGTDMCKTATTMCEPLHGYGFRRGGYQCVCRPGYYYPEWHDSPFLGKEIEEATRDEYDAGFDCIPVEEKVEDQDFVERKETSPRSSFRDRFLKIMKYIRGKRSVKEFLLPDSLAYNAERQFEAEGRTALRLAHFLCSFLQNVDDYEDFGSIKRDRRLSETQIFGEVIANTMSNFKILGTGVFFDRYMFRMSPPSNIYRNVSDITREFFGPYSWRIQTDGDGLDEFRAIDYAGSQEGYTDKPWFREMKESWATNFEALKTYTVKPMIRSDPKGTKLIRFGQYDLTFKAPMYEHGRWQRPEYECDGQVDECFITYVVPFFGQHMSKTKLEFKGVVTVDVKLDNLATSHR